MLKIWKILKRIGEFVGLNNLKFKKFKIQEEFGIWKI